MKKILLLITFYLITCITWGSPFIFSDGYGYYHVGKQLATNVNFIATEKPIYIDSARHAVSEFNGKYVTVYTPGPGLLFVPFLVISSNISETNLDVAGETFVEFNGHTFNDGFAVLIAAMLFSFLSMVLVYKLLLDLGFSNKISSVAIATIWLGFLAFGYVFTFSAMSHTYEIFACSGFLFSIVRYGKKFENKYMLLAGVFASLLVLTRAIDILILVPILIYNLKYRKLKANVYLYLTTIPFILILLAYNYISYGGIFENGYVVIGGSEFKFYLGNIYNLLFSSIRGLFIWSPVLLVALLGLVLYTRKSLQGWLMYLLPVLFLFIGYLFWENWWAGDSIGQRFFLVLIPFFTIGISFVFQKLFLNLKILKFENLQNIVVVLLIFLLTAYSSLTLILYRFSNINEVGEKKTNYQEVPVTERYSPFDVWEYHYEIATKSKNLSEYLTKLQSHLNGGRSMLILLID